MIAAMMKRISLSQVFLSLSCVLALICAGCVSPLARSQEQAMREQLVATHRNYIASVRDVPRIKISRRASDVERDLDAQRQQELDDMSGPGFYQKQVPMMGPDLTGKRMRPELEAIIEDRQQRIDAIENALDVGGPAMTEQERAINAQRIRIYQQEIEAAERDLNEATSGVAAMTLQQAIQLAVNNNLDLRVARVQPAIDQSRLTRAEAAFDATLFANFDFQNLDTPRPPTTAAAFGTSQTETYALTTGIRKLMTTGGQIAMQTSFTQTDETPSLFTVNKYFQSDITISVQQPLLRNFGAAVSKGQIEIATNAQQRSIEQLRQQIMEVAFVVEQAYWQLLLARQRLLIQQRLLSRTIETRDRLKQRGDFDVTPQQITEANSFVELRRADVIRIRQELRSASDQLKQLINAPELPVSGETQIVPVDDPMTEPVAYSTLDAVTSSLRYRPEISVALLDIKDSSVRVRVADNQRLPDLTLSATTRFNGVDTDAIDQAYDRLLEGNFIDWIFGLQFEMPIGNRAAEAQFQENTLQRRAAIINYQRQAQQVIAEVKQALRELDSAYELIGATRSARRAAADNLRAILEQERTGTSLSPEFLDRKLRRQESLADAEFQEFQALTAYNTAIANYYRALGTLLRRNGIKFDDSATSPEHPLDPQ